VKTVSAVAGAGEVTSKIMLFPPVQLDQQVLKTYQEQNMITSCSPMLLKLRGSRISGGGHKLCPYQYKHSCNELLGATRAGFAKARDVFWKTKAVYQAARGPETRGL